MREPSVSRDIEPRELVDQDDPGRTLDPARTLDLTIRDKPRSRYATIHTAPTVDLNAGAEVPADDVATLDLTSK